jgi:hypothetical protein
VTCTASHEVNHAWKKNGHVKNPNKALKQKFWAITLTTVLAKKPLELNQLGPKKNQACDRKENGPTYANFIICTSQKKISLEN